MTCSATSGATPFCSMRAFSRWMAAWSFGSFLAWPMARRSSSASAALNPPSAMEMAMACSWKMGIPYVRFRIGSSRGSGYSTSSSPSRRRV